VSIWYGLYTWFGLSLYWVSPWLIVTHRNHPAPPWFYALCISMYSFGVFFHFAGDMQKHMAMQLRRGHLLTEGLWSRLRNPNYFGELLIYLGFSLVPLHWAPLAALATIVSIVWIPNMLRKDKSLSRYPDFAQYKAQSKYILPRVL
jgi:steroid 5-alpha reductase family enzyme